MAKVSRSGATASNPDETGIAHRGSARRMGADSRAGSASAAPTMKCVIAEAMGTNTIQELKPLLIFFLCALALAQTGADAVSARRLRADLDFLCSDALEGRVSLSRSADVAALYVAAEFERAGLKAAAGTTFLQQFPMVAYEPDAQGTRLKLRRNGKTVELHMGTDFRGGFWRALSIEAPVVFVGYGITAPEYGYDDYSGVDARGKIALIFEHEPQETDEHSIFNGTGHTRYANVHVKLENARRHGAVAALLASEPLRKHAGIFDIIPGQGQPLRASAPRQAIEEDSIPLLQVSDGTAAELTKASGKTPADLQSAIDRSLKPASMPLAVEMEVSTAAANLRRGLSANVVGLIAGSDAALRGETVVITAHYDHLGVQNGRVYRGANDNASGTVGVMELARLLAADATRTRRSLLLIVFGSEEEGLLGSYYYVEHPLRPLETTRAVLNLDMIARDEAHIPQSRGVLEIAADTSNEINLVGAFYSPELREAIVKANRKTGLKLSDKFDRDHDLNTLFRCDHFPFLLHDVPAVWLFGGFHPGYHEPSDTVGKLNFPKLEKVVRLTYQAARSIADSDKTPRFVAKRE
jgi:hypothetical protein